MVRLSGGCHRQGCSANSPSPSQQPHFPCGHAGSVGTVPAQGCAAEDAQSSLLQWESHNEQAQLFPGSLQHHQLTRQAGSPGRFSSWHPISSSANPQLPGSFPCLRALKVMVNGSSLAKDKSFLQGRAQPEPSPRCLLCLRRGSTRCVIPW